MKMVNYIWYFNLLFHVFEPTLFSKYDKVPIERKVIDVTSYLDEFARRAILNPSEVQDLVYQKRFFENIKKGTW